VADPRLSAGTSQPVFYYELGSPACYLVAEQIMSALPVVPEWEPVSLSDVVAVRPGEDDAVGFRGNETDREEIETRAAALGLQPIRWPARWPPDTATAMRAATYAKRVGRAVAFSLAAFRQAFAGGRELGDENTVLIAAAACEMHPTAVLKGIALRSVGEAMRGAEARAAAAGVASLPAIQVGDRVFEGLDAVAGAAQALGAAG
jgi:2-hydroxychromene-2-carboxylate isomerase